MAARNEAERLDVPFLGEVPLDMAIRENSDDGRPLVAFAPDGPHAKAYRDIAARVRAALQGESRAAPKISSRRDRERRVRHGCRLRPACIEDAADDADGFTLQKP